MPSKGKRPPLSPSSSGQHPPSASDRGGITTLNPTVGTLDRCSAKGIVVRGLSRILPSPPPLVFLLKVTPPPFGEWNNPPDICSGPFFFHQKVNCRTNAANCFSKTTRSAVLVSFVSPFPASFRFFSFCSMEPDRAVSGMKTFRHSQAQFRGTGVGWRIMFFLPLPSYPLMKAPTCVWSVRPLAGSP